MKVTVLGTGMTQFGELWEKSLTDLAHQACQEALKDAQLSIKDIDALFVANMLAGQLDNQVHLGALIAQELNFSGPSFRIEAACASGGLAVREAILSLLSSEYQKVLVLGVEKMTDYSTTQISEALMSAASEEEKLAGLTFPSLFALIAKAYMEKYQISEKKLASVSVKNHYHAQFNQKAQFPFPITLNQVLQSPAVAEPLKLLDCSPISDGAAAVILANSESTPEVEELPRQRRGKGHLGGENQGSQVYIIASAQATDSLDLSQRSDLTQLLSVKKAAQKAYQMAKIKPEEIDLVEVHDCFTIAEIMALEALGFYPKGQGSKGAAKKETYLQGKLPVNTSGGLKACGHPVGATGVKQIVEITQQLKGKAGQRQVKDAQIGLTQNIGGTGATAVVHILTNEK